MSATEFRSVMGLWPTGVSVVTGVTADGEPRGVVIGSFCSVSLDPPLVSFCPQKNTSSWLQMRAHGKFCVNFLSEEQSDVCWRFASGDIHNRFAGLPFRVSEGGIPLIEGCCAWVEAEIQEEVDAGDHWIVVGRVKNLQRGASDQPLVFSKGRLSKTAPIVSLSANHFDDWERSLSNLLT